ncbi:Arc family DNA-binding protein [Kaistia terrae]|uniref:Arc family DNA-binding protein n=1 Tax=Kaistia terrae TaxID=537017 RepID=A0ABW0PWU9_9HYPH|nr:Arc family DNA-binding protein [Kaistia terrae]MCX5579440.1 Arc family DNA-binding protein [Kaistia terrae]
MSEKEKFPSDAAERFQLRLPPGLRDRIKAYAEQHGRSMNTEIVRVLENEYPEPWSVESRISELSKLLEVLKGGASNEVIDRFATEVEETINGIVIGRMKGLSAAEKEAIRDRFDTLHEERADSAGEYDPVLDEEEQKAYGLTYRTAKFVGDPKE